MIEIKFEVQDENEALLREFEEICPGILDAALRSTAREFKNYIRRHYLSGNPFQKRTGKMWDDFRHGRYRRATHDFMVSGGPRVLNIFSHSGGANIRPVHVELRRGRDARGRRRKLRVTTAREGFLRFPNVEGNPKFKEWVFVRYVHLPERHVMETATAAFNFQGTFKQSGDKLIDKAIKRRFKEVSGV